MLEDLCVFLGKGQAFRGISQLDAHALQRVVQGVDAPWPEQPEEEEFARLDRCDQMDHRIGAAQAEGENGQREPSWPRLRDDHLVSLKRSSVQVG